jgi:hypothetical protein
MRRRRPREISAAAKHRCRPAGSMPRPGAATGAALLATPLSLLLQSNSHPFSAPPPWPHQPPPPWSRARGPAPRHASDWLPPLQWVQPGATAGHRRDLRRHKPTGARPAGAASASSGLMGYTGRRALPCLGPVQHGPKGIRAGPGLALRHGGPTRPDTKYHRACIVSGLVGPGQVVLGPG